MFMLKNKQKVVLNPIFFLVVAKMNTLDMRETICAAGPTCRFKLIKNIGLRKTIIDPIENQIFK